MIQELKLRSSFIKSKVKPISTREFAKTCGSGDFKSTDTTYHNTFRDKEESHIIDSLKYFVDNSKSIKKIEQKQRFGCNRFVTNGFKKRDNSILRSIYEENKFNARKGKNKLKRTNSASTYFEYKPKYDEDHSNKYINI